MEQRADTEGSVKTNPKKSDRESFLISSQARKDFKEFGGYLRRERELRNLSLEEIAQVTRVNLRYLAAIEEGKRENLPAVPFLKGFISAYCKHIGLDPEDVLTYFDEVNQENTPEQKEIRVVAAERGKRSRRPILLVGLGVGLLGLFLVIAFVLRRPVAVPPPADETAPTAPATSETPTGPVAANDEQDQDRTVQPAAPGVELNLAAVEKSWVYAVIDEEKVKDFFLQPGEKIALNGERTITLTLGNAGGVSVTFNGKELGLLGKADEAKRDILFTNDPAQGPQMSETFKRLGEKAP